MSARYAIYFAPAAASALWDFGCGVLGYDAVTGLDRDFHPELAAVDGWPALTAEPRRYGFHATLKAPFELAEDVGEDDLRGAVEAFARIQRSTAGPDLVVAALGRFVALVPGGANPRIDEIASGAVLAFERFRAPLTVSERERRLAAGLTPRQIMRLDQYGYPYVLEDFRFHMTLTGPLDKDRIEPVRALLDRLYASLRAPLALDQVCLFRQETRESRFRIIHRAALTP